MNQAKGLWALGSASITSCLARGAEAPRLKGVLGDSTPFRSSQAPPSPAGTWCDAFDARTDKPFDRSDDFRYGAGRKPEVESLAELNELVE